jgi:SNF2 family DNA or RNA helicase
MVREAAQYWRKAERECAENRKKAEREEMEMRRRQTEQKETDRQKKKLEFLLTQTELYSHFIGRKMGIVEEPSSSSAAAPSSSLADAASTLLTHASSIRNEAGDLTADEAARQYIADQREKMKEFDRLETGRNGTAVQREEEKKEGGHDGTTEGNQDSTKMEVDSTSLSVSKLEQKDAEDHLDLLNPSTMPQQESFVSAASSFQGSLKSYQLRGLNWLLNLYEQGINGILADEMGLGKTVQSIAFLSYLSATKDCWGPFLIVAPNSTLHQWQQEVSRFVPSLKVLPYWGGAKERQILRQFWTSKKMYTKDAPFHVLITSYNVVVQDERYFQRMRFMYMILDEAQAIKNAASQRWKSLLGLKCRNRVLLTGTPIQNSMAELWALLHFIMPSLFESHDDFQEWFSKDVEDAAAAVGTGGAGEKEAVPLDHRQIQRLHVILKPFMLRRCKVDVENEMPPKIEVTLPCKLSAVQMRIYKALQKKIVQATEAAGGGVIGKKSFLSHLTSSTSFSSSDAIASDSLVTLVMQFRKLCNHPELYERKQVISSYWWGEKIWYPLIKQKSGSNPSASNVDPELAANGGMILVRCPAAYEGGNPISKVWPTLLERGLRVDKKARFLEQTNIFATENVWRRTYGEERRERGEGRSSLLCNPFSFLPFLLLSASEFSFYSHSEALHAWFACIVLQHRRHIASLRADAGERVCLILEGKLARLEQGLELSDLPSSPPLPNRHVLPSFPTRFCFTGKGLVWKSPAEFFHASSLLRRFRRCARPAVLASPIHLRWSRHLGSRVGSSISDGLSEYVGWEKSVLLGVEAWKWSRYAGGRNRQGNTWPVSFTQTLEILPSGLQEMQRRIFVASPYTETQARAMQIAKTAVNGVSRPPPQLSLYTSPSSPLFLSSLTLHSSSSSSSHPIPGLLSSVSSLGCPSARMLVPTVEDLIADSGKLQVLDQLLTQLKREGHRVLIFSQMTKLIDLLENFLTYRKYKFSRLDGQTALSARRDLVRKFQNDSSVFAFLLSTRAGGLVRASERS